MNNKYLYIILGVIVAVVWFYAGHSAFFSGDTTHVSDYWMFALVLAVGLGAGSTGGDDAVSIFVGSIKEYVPTLILLGIFAVVGYGLYMLAIERTTPDVAVMGRVVITFLASGFLTNMMLSYLRKANA